MKTAALCSIGLLGLAKVATAAVMADWPQRSIYQTMTDRFARSDGNSDEDCDLMDYCGGSWSGLIRRLDYIQGMGFTAVQISPIVKNIPEKTPYGEAYHGYWVQDNYALNANFGTAEELNELINELHDRDMYLILDVVINNMAAAINGTMNKKQDIDYSILNPFNEKKYYHDYCNITDYDVDDIAQNCWLGAENVALPDLDTESDEVIKMTNDWITETLSNFSVDALRIDAAKHVDTPFLKPFVKAANVFTMGEVFSGEIPRVCPYQEQLSGLPNYPVWFPLVQAFTAGDMKGLAKMVGDVEQECDFKTLGTFAENHDIPRFGSYTEDMALASNALAFIILADGIPMVYQGQEQHFKGNYSPYNREALWTSNYDTDAPLYKLTAKLNTLRNHAISIDSRYVEHSKQLYLDDATYAMRKGPDGVQIVSVFSNQGEEGGKYQLNVPKGFEAGTEVVEIFSCDRTRVNSAGNLTVEMDQGAPKVFFPTAQLNGSGLCGSRKSTGSGSGSSNSSGNATDSDDDEEGAAGQVQIHLPTLAMAMMVAFAFWLL